MTKNEFKIGDTVRFKGKKKIHIITEINEYGQYIVSEYPKWSFSAEHLEHAEFPDRKTAFLSELQALLRKYDAEIRDGEMYYISIDIDVHSENTQEIDYPLYKMDKFWLDADNIMDFDKE